MRVLVVGHLPVHLGPLARGLSEHCEVDILSWKPMRLFNKGSALLIVPLLVLCIIFRSMQKGIDLTLAQYAFPDGFSSTLASKILGVPSVVQVIGSDVLIGARGIKKRLVGWTVSKASGVMCVSRNLEEVVQEMGAKKTVVLPSPLDISDLPKDIDARRVDKRLITIATLTRIKGIETLLKALQDITDAELVVVGDGPERENLEKLASDLKLENRVRFVGQVPHDQIWKHLFSSSIFVLPSLSEGLPRALLEAMACGLFVIASKVGGIPEVIKDGWNGILVSPHDPKALKDAIVRSLGDRKLVETTGERNKLEAQRFILDRVAERQFLFLSSIVLQRRKTGRQ